MKGALTTRNTRATRNTTLDHQNWQFHSFHVQGQSQRASSCTSILQATLAMKSRWRSMLRILPILLELGRVRFLVYSPIAYAAGVTCATAGTAATSFSLPLFLLGQLFVTSTHMLTHFFNEYYDLAADAAHEFPSPWTGGSRVLVRGDARPATSIRLGRTLTVLSCTTIIAFPNSTSKLIAVLIVLLAIGYSAPPLRLGTRGLGELDVALVLNTLVPLLGFALFQTEESNPALLLGLIPPAVVEFVRMMVMNMADVVGDARAGKRTLVVRLGLDASVRWHMRGMAAAYVALVGLFLWARIGAATFVLQMATLPMAAVIVYRLYWRREYLSVAEFWNLPFVSTQHNGLLLVAALLGLVWGDTARGMVSSLSQQRMAAVWVFFGVQALKAWLGWRSGRLTEVFSPQLGKAERVARAEDIQRWEHGLASAAQPFRGQQNCKQS